MPLILGTNSIKDTGYSVANSCRFDSATDAHMHITYGTAGNQKKWSWSGWIKRGTNFTTHQNLFAVGTANNNFTFLQFNTSSNIVWYQATSGGTTSYLETDAIYRDPGAWMHVLLSIDTTLSTANNRNRLWVNGTEVTSFTYRTNYDQNHDGGINDDVKHYLGGTTTGISDAEWDGYMAEVVFQDGVAHTGAGDFGEFDSDSPNIWKPKDVSGLTFGSNGFYLDFEDSSALGNDISGNNNDLTVSNIAATDQANDSCTNNYATMNPLDYGRASDLVVSHGNLDVATGGTARGLARSTIGVSSGKWYWEVNPDSASGGNALIGVSAAYNDYSRTADNELGSLPYEYAFYQDDGKVYNNDTGASYGSSYSNGNIIGVYLDLDNNKIYFSVNGSLQNSGTGIDVTDPASTSEGFYFFCVGDDNAYAERRFELNFGNPISALSSAVSDDNGHGSFEYSPNITGDSAAKKFYAVNTKNLAEYG